MSVVLLDPRFPDVIPVDAVPHLRGEIRYTDEVGVHVRWVVSDIAARAQGADDEARGAHSARPEPVLMSTDAEHPEVLAAINRGETVYASAYRGTGGADAPRADSSATPAHLRGIEEALQVMERALTIGGWERAQTHESLLPYLEEESGEFAEAVRQYAPGDTRPSLQGAKQLEKELGDVLLQVLFHAQIAANRGDFDFDAVARSFVAKMRARSPYLFDGTTEIVDEETQMRLWEDAKQQEDKPFDPLTADASLLPPLEPRGLLDLPPLPGMDV
ncbi:nucleoside triphosphate hydrolase [Corynebacterium sp. 13CS0277]|uniref:MazG nucleotide pyrophosphohydrolase domain-containing protein n=1 Tax=Corynebacterium sp. 13CS0277 TaxID=2071994 RepID=UPI000D0476DB|nr:MazG nucleotide pyrophosphohydrolase domain-containing protein [Corynebacterium sp. 13CS0277]PRQ12480.1 nucleoside triphosphate hydrolase [Corynebacterium sp. 13CS0277]